LLADPRKGVGAAQPLVSDPPAAAPGLIADQCTAGADTGVTSKATANIL
jgi:hypothetical protein